PVRPLVTSANIIQRLYHAPDLPSLPISMRTCRSVPPTCSILSNATVATIPIKPLRWRLCRLSHLPFNERWRVEDWQSIPVRPPSLARDIFRVHYRYTCGAPLLPRGWALWRHQKVV